MDLFTAADILYVPLRMTLERLHQVMQDAEKLDEPEEETEEIPYSPCNCPEGACRC